MHAVDWMPTLVAAAGGTVDGRYSENYIISKYFSETTRSISKFSLMISHRSATVGTY